MKIQAVLVVGLSLTGCQSEVLVPVPFPYAIGEAPLTELLFTENNPTEGGAPSDSLRVQVLDARAPLFSVDVPEGVTTRWSAVLSPHAACDEGFDLGPLIPSAAGGFVPKLGGPEYQRFRASSLNGKFEPWQADRLPELQSLSYVPPRCSKIFETEARPQLPGTAINNLTKVTDVAVTANGAVAALILRAGACSEETELAYYTVGSDARVNGRGPPCIERLVEDGTTGEHLIAAHERQLSRLDRESQVVTTVPVGAPITTAYAARALLRREGRPEVFAVYSTTVAPEQTFVVGLAPLTLERTTVSAPLPGAVALALMGAEGTIELLTTDEKLISLSPELEANAVIDVGALCETGPDFEASGLISVDGQLVIANAGPGPAISILSADRRHCRHVDDLHEARARAVDVAPGPGKRLVIFLEGFEGSSDPIAIITPLPADGSRRSPLPLRTYHYGPIKGLYRAKGGLGWLLNAQTLEQIRLTER